MSATSLSTLSANAAGNYRTWLSELQQRFQHYLKLAAAPPAAAASGDNGSSHNSDAQMLQMTRREIEVLAAYHCELQRMINDQNQRIESANTELQESNDLAERLQVEVEKRNGGGISPRRQAKQALRAEIAATRRQIDDVHRNLQRLQEELEGVRAEHADVRAFVSKQFFPVARVRDDQKWRDQNKTTTAAAALGKNKTDGGADEEAAVGGEAKTTTTFAHGGQEFVVRPTKAVELREALIAERRKGFVPGTRIKSSTFDAFKNKEAAEGSRAGAAPAAASGPSGNNSNNTTRQMQAASSQRLKQLPPDGPLPHQLGQKGFVLKKVGPKQSRSPNGAGATAQLSQERHVRASAEGRRAFRGPSLASTTEAHGIMPHHDPARSDDGTASLY